MKRNPKRVATMSRPAKLAIELFSLGLLSIIMLSTSVVVAQTPSSAISHFNVGIKEIKKNNFDRAIEEFTIAIEISSHPVQPRAGKRVLPQRLASGAELDSTAGTRTITILDKFTALAYVNRCFARNHKGDFAGAIADCDQAIRITPRLAEGYLNRGIARKMVGDETAALVDLNKALAIDANLVAALVGRGSLRTDSGDIEGALSDLNRALALDPRSEEAYVFRGYALIAKPDLAGAISDFNEAIKLRQDFAAAYLGRGVAQTFLGLSVAQTLKNDLALAIKDFTRALELDPTLALAYENRGLAFLLQGKEVEASEDFRRCLTVDPGLKEDLDRRIKVVRELHIIP
jgi:tetratricopeptide (TPR) repeat protein